ncbi:MAG: protoporphyrinogen oxidase [Melioribacteraceae bacterium]|nr:MAG: protoporphyrinogen oxidase [Melioribacteraceae bacterium]
MINKKVIVLGAGISGLATSYWLKKDGFDVNILESKSEPGGAMETITKNGFTIDFGPNSGLETTPLISKLAEEVGLKEQMIYANDEANKRYILRDGKLHALPTSPRAFIKTKLFSTKAKLRVMGEPFIGKSKDGYYQSIAEFVERRLGKEFLDYAIDPFVSGVFAGDPNKLSVKSAFPKLYRLEEVYGGLVKGMIKGAKERKQRNEESKQSAKMFSFINGMQSFPEAIAKKFENKIEYDTKVEIISKSANGYEITYSVDGERKSLSGDILLSTIPVHKAANYFLIFDNEFTEHATDIFYPPVLVLYIGYKKEQIKRELDGFGFLIPSKMGKNFLGAIWSSTIFKNRAPNGYASFTLFVGGARRPNLFDESTDTIVNKAIKEFSEIMNIDGKPELIVYREWQKAIPQYNLGYIEHENYFDKFEKENPGIFLSGNYRGGISVGDCVKNSEIVFNKIRTFAS